MAKKKVDVAREVLHQVGQEVEQQAKAEITVERIALAYRRLFESEDGEIVLADLKARFDGTTVRVRSNGIDPYETHFREGQRYIYRHLCEAKVPPPPITQPQEN
jgi:hypothetical protein